VCGFLCAVVGLFIPTGIVAFIGLAMCLAALGRPPRFLAFMGVLIGLLGTLIWFTAILGLVVAVVVVIAAVLVMALAGVAMTSPEVPELTSDMVNIAVAVAEYSDEFNEAPTDLALLDLNEVQTIDPWGTPYILTGSMRDEHCVASAGPDRVAGTDDDIDLNGLERLWDRAFQGLEGRMRDLGERLEHLDDRDRGRGKWGRREEAQQSISRYQRYEEAAEASVPATEPRRFRPR